MFKNEYVNKFRISSYILICSGVVAATKIFIVVASVFGRNNNFKMDEIAILATESS